MVCDRNKKKSEHFVHDCEYKKQIKCPHVFTHRFFHDVNSKLNRFSVNKFRHYNCYPSDTKCHFMNENTKCKN